MRNGETVYIGDGVYASFDGYQVWLSTIPGGGASEIAIEPQVLQTLLQQLKKDPGLYTYMTGEKA